MKLICKQKTAQGLDLKKVTIISSNNYDFGLEIGKVYQVMGMATYRDTNCLYYLIDEDGRPDWFPYVLFTVSDNVLPKNWYIKLYDQNLPGDIFSLVGFKELCNDDFYVRLVEREEKAMRIYFRRKIELENVEKEELL
jgi:hypothetical protein